VVYTLPEQTNLAIQAGCKDFLKVEKDNDKWLQIATLNNELDAKILAEKVSGWYEEQNRKNNQELESN
jgi:hypothetical protein